MYKKNSLATRNRDEQSEDTQVVLHLPDRIGIELVQANELRHYELFNWLVGINSSIAVGFWTAFVNENTSALGWSAGAFTAITILFLILALIYRRKVYHGNVERSLCLGDFRMTKTKVGHDSIKS